MVPRAQEASVAEHPPGGSGARTSWTRLVDTWVFATKISTPNDMTVSATTLLKLCPAARQAGLTAQIEQKMLIEGQTQDDGTLALGSARRLHSADVQIIEVEGSELWLEVRIHTVRPEQPVQGELLREKQAKCRAYGQKHGFDQQLTKGINSVVLNQYGDPAWGTNNFPEDHCT